MLYKVHGFQAESTWINTSMVWLNGIVHLTTNDKIKQRGIDFNNPICLNLTNNNTTERAIIGVPQPSKQLENQTCKKEEK